MEGSNILFCSSEFPWARERICYQPIENLGTRTRKVSPVLMQRLDYGETCFNSRRGSDLSLQRQYRLCAPHSLLLYGALSPGGLLTSRSSLEADHSPPSISCFKNEWSYILDSAKCHGGMMWTYLPVQFITKSSQKTRCSNNCNLVLGSTNSPIRKHMHLSKYKNFFYVLLTVHLSIILATD